MSNGYDNVLVIVDKLIIRLFHSNDYYNYKKELLNSFFHHVIT